MELSYSSPEQTAEMLDAMEHDLLLFGYTVCPELAYSKTECVLHKDIARLHHSRHRFSAIIAPRGHAKCISSDTPVWTTKGMQRIGDMTTSKHVYCCDDRGKLQERQVTAVYDVGVRDSVVIKTRSGKKLTIAPNHPLFTFDGYKNGEDIKVGNYVAGLSAELDGHHPIDDDELTFITHMIFEGCCREDMQSYCNTDDGVVSDFKEACMQLGISLTQVTEKDYRVLGGKNGVAQELQRKYKVYGKLSKEKRLPASFFAMPLCQKWRFIDIMFATDGYFAREAGNAGICLASEGLIDDIQLLLQSCGIVSSKTYKPNDYSGAWALSIGRAFLPRVAENCNLFHKRTVCTQLVEETVGYSLHDIFPDELKREVSSTAARQRGIRTDNHYEMTRLKLEKLAATFPDCEVFQQQLGQDLFWDKVVSIERGILTHMTDITVEETGNFFANGILSHNTTWASTIATLHDLAYDRENVIIPIKKTFYQAVTDIMAITNQIKYNTIFNHFFGPFEFLMDRQEKVWIRRKQSGHLTWIEGRGALQAIRGIRDPDGRRATKIFPDDFEDENNTMTIEQRDKMRDYVAAQIMPSMEVENAKLFVIGTIVHYDSWLNNIYETWQRAQKVDEKTSWHVIYHQMIENGKPIWPERFTEEYIEELKFSYAEIGKEDKYYQEYMNIPYDPAAAAFKREHIHYFKGYMKWDKELGHILYKSDDDQMAVDVVAAYDLSSGESGDFTGWVILATDGNGNRHYIEAERAKLKPDEVKDMLFKHFTQYHPRVMVLEKDALGRVMEFWLKREMRERNVFLPLRPEKIVTRMHKEDKLEQALQPLYNQDIMHHRDTQHAFFEELFTFPKQKHDDILDAAYMANRYARLPGITLKEKIKRRLRADVTKRYDWMVGGAQQRSRHDVAVILEEEAA